MRQKTERGGFEPPVREKPHTPFPRVHHRPLGHLSEVRAVIIHKLSNFASGNFSNLIRGALTSAGASGASH